MTTNEDVLIREVDEELNQDRQLAAFKKYGPYLAAAALVALALVAFLQVRAAREQAALREASEAYEFTLADDAAPGALLDFAGTVPAEGYRALALMRAGGAAARAGERVQAIQAYAAVYDDEGLPDALRDLARVRAGYLALEDGGSAADGIVAGVATPAFAPFAREIGGLSAMARGEYESAAASFASAAEADGPVGARASTFLALARAGAAGVTLEAQTSPDDFLGEFGRALREGDLDLPGEAADEAPAAQTPPTEAVPQDQGAE